MESLQLLHLYDTGTTEIKELTSLVSLKYLYLQFNRIENINGLEKLTKLKLLSLSYNRIRDVNGLGKLPELTDLDLSNNHIRDIRPLISLIGNSNITKITASDYGIDDFAVGRINIRQNPLVVPPMEIAEQGTDAILRFFTEKLEEKYEAKILIVGEPEAGKTSLMKKLTEPGYVIPADEDSTIGIKVIKWNCNHPGNSKPIEVNIWDFGGQEMQYLTHQFFLTSDALYVLLTSARKDYDNLDYWFNIISLLGKNESNQNSELLVLANEIKMQKDQVLRSFDEKKYHDLYPHLPFTFHSVNLATACDKDGRFATLQHLIKEKLMQLPILGKKLPEKWGVVRKRLNDLNVNYITIKEYFSICKEAEIDEKLALDLSGYLHKIGEAVHFQNDYTVENYLILNPKWAVDGVYSILKKKEIENNDGHFTKKQVYDIWEQSGYEYAERNLLLSLMVKDNFEVAYKIPNKKDSYIAPQLLSISQPSFNWDKSGALHFRYFYPFMPKGILTRLIVRLHEMIKYEKGKGLVWRTGVILEKNGCQAKVIETKIVATGQQVIAIEVLGNKNNRKLLLYEIANTIEKIHKDSFSQINFERQVPCNCDYCCMQEEPGFFDYSKLVEYINEDIDKIRCNLRVKNEVEVKSLLKDIFDVDFTKLNIEQIDHKRGNTVNEALVVDPFSYSNKEKKKKKIFISYSQKDTRFTLTNGVTVNFKDELETHLKSLKRLGIAEVWSDSNLLGGDAWDDEIKNQLADSDIILFLVSANLIATDYVWDEEMPLAKYRNENNNTVIIPVIPMIVNGKAFLCFPPETHYPGKENRLPLTIICKKRIMKSQQQ